MRAVQPRPTSGWMHNCRRKFIFPPRTVQEPVGNARRPGLRQQFLGSCLLCFWPPFFQPLSSLAMPVSREGIVSQQQAAMLGHDIGLGLALVRGGGHRGHDAAVAVCDAQGSLGNGFLLHGVSCWHGAAMTRCLSGNGKTLPAPSSEATWVSRPPAPHRGEPTPAHMPRGPGPPIPPTSTQSPDLCR